MGELEKSLPNVFQVVTHCDAVHRSMAWDGHR